MADSIQKTIAEEEQKKKIDEAESLRIKELKKKAEKKEDERQANIKGYLVSDRSTVLFNSIQQDEMNSSVNSSGSIPCWDLMPQRPIPRCPEAKI